MTAEEAAAIAKAVSSLTDADLQGIIKDALGDSFENLDGAKQAAAVAALNKIGQLGSRAAASQAKAYLNECIKNGNLATFQKLKGDQGRYITLRAISFCTGYRYVYSDSRKEVTLTKGSNVFKFKDWSDEITLRDGTVEKLSAPIELMKQQYVAEADAKKYFACEAEFIYGTNYGVTFNEKMAKLVEEMVAASRKGV